MISLKECFLVGILASHLINCTEIKSDVQQAQKEITDVIKASDAHFNQLMQQNTEQLNEQFNSQIVVFEKKIAKLQDQQQEVLVSFQEWNQAQLALSKRHSRSITKQHKRK